MEAQILSFMKDKDGPFKIGFQEQVSNHLKQLLLRVIIVISSLKLYTARYTTHQGRNTSTYYTPDEPWYGSFLAAKILLTFTKLVKDTNCIVI